MLIVILYYNKTELTAMLSMVLVSVLTLSRIYLRANTYSKYVTHLL